ncbi:MAG: manganese catalase family protein [Clostridiales bacterium]|jgi:spore coat protein JC|nr:manganese catalase family protein [Clostridiales bacterium]
MWTYEKKLQYPIKIKNANPRLAKAIITQYGGPDGELGASLRYLSQRYTMPNDTARAALNDIGTEELGHLEMVGTIVHQLTRNLTMPEIKKFGFDDYYADHRVGVYTMGAGGAAFDANAFAVKGDPIADLHENLAAEQKARSTYENLIRIADDPDVIEPLKVLRAREIVHFQRFGEVLRGILDDIDRHKVFAVKK